jgi:formylmethanofuran dehydrogenase subunit B
MSPEPTRFWPGRPGDVDACLFVGSEGAGRFSRKAWEYLQEIPVITLDYPNVQTPLSAAVRFTSAVYGIHRPGTAYRMDGVPIPLSHVLDSSYPSDEETLNSINRQLP